MEGPNKAKYFDAVSKELREQCEQKKSRRNIGIDLPLKIILLMDIIKLVGDTGAIHELAGFNNDKKIFFLTKSIILITEIQMCIFLQTPKAYENLTSCFLE